MSRLYHRTCDHGAAGIRAAGTLLPNRHPWLPRPLVWMTDRPDTSRKSLGLTSHTLTCDRMAHLFVVEPDRAMPWLVYCRRNGIDPRRIPGNAKRWWVKRCTRCGEEWPADTEFFPRDAGRPDGLNSWCKACWSEYKAERRQEEVA